MSDPISNKEFRKVRLQSRGVFTLETAQCRAVEEGFAGGPDAGG